MFGSDNLEGFDEQASVAGPESYHDLDRAPMTRACLHRTLSL